MVLKKLLKELRTKNHAENLAELKRNLIRREAKLGGRLFGPVDKGVSRDFFCLDAHTWVLHEERTDLNGQRAVKNIRYDVRPNGVLKAVNGGHYQRANDREVRNLYEAAKAYETKVNNELYGFVHP